jgi:tetratricopeptide (TPR) repeat protein
MVRAWHTAIAATVLVAGIGLASGTMAQSVAPQAKGNAAPAPATKGAAKKPAAEAKTEAKKDPSVAQGQIDAAVASLGSGKVDVAIQQLTAVLSGGGLPAAQMARALYYRGIAYRKQSKPAQAIADLTSALWLKNGLAAAERADALENRAAAYREAGLSDQADADMAKVASTRTGKPGADAPQAQTQAGGGQAAAVATKTAAAPQAEAKVEAKAESAAPASSSSSGGGGGIGSFFGNIFGGGTASASAEQSKPAPRTASVSEWSASTEVRSAGKAGAAVVAPDTTASIGKAQVTAAAQKAFTLQVAAVRSRAEAQAVAQKLKQQHAADIGSRNTEIDEAVVGNMGTLYRVRVGPFADANEPRSLCSKLRSTGLDCMLVTQ